MYIDTYIDSSGPSDVTALNVPYYTHIYTHIYRHTHINTYNEYKGKKMAFEM